MKLLEGNRVLGTLTRSRQKGETVALPVDAPSLSEWRFIACRLALVTFTNTSLANSLSLQILCEVSNPACETLYQRNRRSYLLYLAFSELKISFVYTTNTQRYERLISSCQTTAYPTWLSAMMCLAWRSVS